MFVSFVSLGADSKRTVRRTVSAVCRHCGSTFETWLYHNKRRVCCSRYCASRYAANIGSQLPRDGRGRIVKGSRLTSTSERVCEGCGIVFTTKVRRKNAGRFHSRACAFAFVDKRVRAKHQAQAELRTERAADWQRTLLARMRPCDNCSAPYLPRLPQSRFCSHSCRRAQKPRPYKVRRDLRQCSDCGAEFIANHRKKVRCKRCIGKKYGRAKSHAARAKRLGLPRDYSVKSLKVFARDRWRCCLCGCKTPKRLAGKSQPLSPTVDHIVPISKGGGHTWDNVQLACHQCNMKKHARVRGQLRLAI
jgi:5-methylcytosine-specific restriction endonuclease McrA